MPNPSPLRYPGGKNRLAGFIRLVIQNLNMPNCTYVEPFAGGAGVALSLLLDNTVDRIVINDYDKAIYSFWRAVKQEPASLIDLIQSTPVTIDEWYRQKEIAAFVENFIEMFNKLAESNDVDAIPPTIQNDGVEEDNSAPAQ